MEPREIILRAITQGVEEAMRTIISYDGCEKTDEIIDVTVSEIIEIAKAHAEALADGYKRYMG